MASGRDIKAAFVKATTWHTAAVAGTGDGVFLLSEAFPPKVPGHLRNEEAGRPFVESYDQGSLDISGSVDAFLRYLGLDVMIAMVMGTAGAPTRPDPGGNPTVYRNSYRLADRLAGRFGTLVIDKRVSIWEYPSVKLTGFEIRGEAGQPLTIRFDGIADNLKRSGDETTSNTSTSLASVTFPTRGLRAMFSQDKFRLNDRAGAALSDADSIYPASFIFRYRRPMRGDHVADGTQTVIEPQEDGLPEASLQLKFDEYSGDAHLNSIRSATVRKGDILFSGPVISGSYLYEFKLTFPSLVPMEAEASVRGAGKIIHTVTFDCLATDVAPAGMAGITLPFQVDIQNTRATDPLA